MQNSKKKLLRKSRKIFAFIDGENVRNSAQEAGYKDLDYEKVYEWLTKKKDVLRIYLYVAVRKKIKKDLSIFNY
ncbi:MAG: NYN domain-containing protein [Candidatus Pacebacteria bacterium]|nr:NYN domain-containing protein [Candidatus Paceibacterota bacterium]